MGTPPITDTPVNEPSPVVIVGSGPAGTSVALALVERGIPVLILEAGTRGIDLPPDGSYLDLRFNDSAQWQWMFGRAGEAMRASANASPKLRIPGLQPIFADYSVANHMRPSADFGLVGALAPGGLSNAWGCGVAAFERDELGVLVSEHAAMKTSYARVATRMGISGASDDPLQAMLGIDAYSSPALPLDDLHAHLWARRNRLDSPRHAHFILGRARVAALSTARENRDACDLSGMCLWGCSRRSTWSAAHDLAALRAHPLAKLELGVRVQSLGRDRDGHWLVEADTAEGHRSFHARKVLLAAGTLASTRLVLATLPAAPSVLKLQSNPMAAFLVWIPTALGQPRSRSFGLAQLSFNVAASDAGSAFGNLFSTAGLPVSEFAAHLPMSRRAAIPLLRGLLSSTVVGNVFLPGSLSAHEVSLQGDHSLQIKGGRHGGLDEALRVAKQRISLGLRALGGWMIPGSFVAGASGADLHYACTLPMRERPAPHECTIDGEVAGLSGVYVVDGASLPLLPAKAHTLTIMANADRIGRRLSLN